MKKTWLITVIEILPSVQTLGQMIALTPNADPPDAGVVFGAYARFGIAPESANPQSFSIVPLVLDQKYLTMVDQLQWVDIVGCHFWLLPPPKPGS